MMEKIKKLMFIIPLKRQKMQRKKDAEQIIKETFFIIASDFKVPKNRDKTVFKTIAPSRGITGRRFTIPTQKLA